MLILGILIFYSIQLPAEGNFETILIVISGSPYQTSYVKYSDSDSGRPEPPANLYMVEYITTETADSPNFKALVANSRRIISQFMMNYGPSMLVVSACTA